MKTPCEHVMKALAEGFADGEAIPRWDAESWAHIKSCDSCRGAYNRLARIERFTRTGSAAVISPRELSMMGKGAIEGALAQDAALAEATAPARRRWWAWSMIAFAGATGALLFFMIPVLSRNAPSATHDGEGFQARSAGLPGAARSGVRAFCLDGAGAKVTPLDPRDGEPAPACPRAGLLKLTVSNRGAHSHLFVVGFDDEYNAKWYAPRPPATTSVAAPPAGTVDQPLGGAIHIATNHDAGPLAVFAIYSSVPLSSAEIEAAAARLAKDKVPLHSVEALPLARTSASQHVVRLRITP